MKIEKIDFKNGDTCISKVHGYHKGWIGKYWVHYMSDAVWTKSLSLFFLNLN